MISAFFVLFLMIVECEISLKFPKQNLCSSPLIKSIANNQLPIFLLSNIVTGLINMSIDTIAYTPIQGFKISYTYAIFIAIISYSLDYYKNSGK